MDSRLQKALTGTSLQPMFPEFETVARTAFILALEHVPTGVTLELAIGVSGFEQMIIQRAQDVVLAGQSLPVATAEDLILLLLAGRPQDNQDVTGIVEKQSHCLDWDYISSIARQLEEAVEIDLSKKVACLRSD